MGDPGTVDTCICETKLRFSDWFGRPLLAACNVICFLSDEEMDTTHLTVRLVSSAWRLENRMKATLAPTAANNREPANLKLTAAVFQISSYFLYFNYCSWPSAVYALLYAVHAVYNCILVHRRYGTQPATCIKINRVS